MTVISDLYRQLFGRSGTTKGSDIDMAEHGRAGGVSTGQPFKFVGDVNYAIKVTTSGTITYIGIAPVGSNQSDAVWQCKKVDESVTNTIIITWADSGRFSQVATDLTALSYS